jgi:hypothetical protein
MKLIKARLAIAALVAIATVVAVVFTLSLGTANAPRARLQAVNAQATSQPPTASTTANPQPEQSTGDKESPEHDSEAAGEQPEAAGDAHQDPAQQEVDHQCPPDCDTAHGEVP